MLKVKVVSGDIVRYPADAIVVNLFEGISSVIASLRPHEAAVEETFGDLLQEFGYASRG